MNNRERVQKIEDLFVTRKDTYVTQWKSEKGIGYQRRDAPLTPETVFDHLRGVQTVSVYPIGDDDKIKWVCFDVDVSMKAKKELDADDGNLETQKQTKNLARILFQLRIPFRVEFSGSKGYHVWVFFQEPIPTHKGFDLATFIRSYLPLNPFVNVEIIPKHRTNAEVSYSLAAKLPLGIHKKTDKRCFFVDNTFTYHEDQWEILANIKPLTEDAVDAILKEYQIEYNEPQRRTVSLARDYVCLSNMMKDGIDDGARDEGLFQLACYFQMQGIPQDMALTMLEEVNGKAQTPLDTATVERKVTSAYEKQYYPSPCREPLLDPFCSVACRRWGRKVEQRWTRFGHSAESAVGVIGH